MFKSKYGKVLTIILIIAVVAIIALLCFWGYKKIANEKELKEAAAATEEFDEKYHVTSKPKPVSTPTPNVEDKEEEGELLEIVETTPTTGGSTGGSSSSKKDNKSYYKGFVMIGYIEIPKTNVKLPILEKVTKKSLETSVAVAYPENAKLNEPGNVVIAGHNYRNQLFFSNNKKLTSGDKIYIADENGRKMTYTVYDKFEAAPEDTSFYARDTGGVPEITLTTCTNDVNKRTIVLARAQ